MTTTIDTRIEPFQERDGFDCLRDMNRITAEIKIDDVVVWTKTGETKDYIESVFSLRDELGWEAVRHAVAHHGYDEGEEDAETFGMIVSTA